MHDKPNWLLQALIGVSFILHGTALLCMPDAAQHKTTTTSVIELTLEEIPPAAPLTKPLLPEPEKKRQEPQRAIIKPALAKKPVVQPKPLPEEPIKSVATPQPVVPPPPELASRPEIDAPTEQVAMQEDFQKPPAPPLATELKPAEDSFRNYLALIRQRIERFKRYPLSARMKQLEGEATIGFVLTQEGEARQLAVIKSSGRQILDQAALSAVRKASPLPPPPAALSANTHNMQITVLFTLARGRSGL